MSSLSYFFAQITLDSLVDNTVLGMDLHAMPFNTHLAHLVPPTY